MYIQLEDGRVARYGGDDAAMEWMEKQEALGKSTAGKGWMGARASVPSVVMTQDDPFVFDQFLFGNSDDVKRPIGKTVKQITEEASGLSTSPKVGAVINELKIGADGKITQFHGGNYISDLYEKEGKITLLDNLDRKRTSRTAPKVLSVSSLDDLEFNERPGKYFPVQIPTVKETEPVTKRIGPTPPESGTTLKNVGREPAQTRLRGKAIEKVYPTPNLGHEATIADIENIKKQRQKADEAAQRAEQKAQERAQKKVTRRTERKTKAEAARAATETAEQASKNPGGIPVRRTG